MGEGITGDVSGMPDLHAILFTATEIAEALAYLHSKSVLHGTLKSTIKE